MQLLVLRKGFKQQRKLISSSHSIVAKDWGLEFVVGHSHPLGALYPLLLAICCVPFF